MAQSGHDYRSWEVKEGAFTLNSSSGSVEGEAPEAGKEGEA